MYVSNAFLSPFLRIMVTNVSRCKHKCHKWSFYRILSLLLVKRGFAKIVVNDKNKKTWHTCKYCNRSRNRKCILAFLGTGTYKLPGSIASNCILRYTCRGHLRCCTCNDSRLDSMFAVRCSPANIITMSLYIQKSQTDAFYRINVFFVFEKGKEFVF